MARCGSTVPSLLQRYDTSKTVPLWGMPVATAQGRGRTSKCDDIAKCAMQQEKRCFGVEACCASGTRHSRSYPIPAATLQEARLLIGGRLALRLVLQAWTCPCCDPHSPCSRQLGLSAVLDHPCAGILSSVIAPMQLVHFVARDDRCTSHINPETSSGSLTTFVRRHR